MRSQPSVPLPPSLPTTRPRIPPSLRRLSNALALPPLPCGLGRNASTRAPSCCGQQTTSLASTRRSAGGRPASVGQSQTSLCVPSPPSWPMPTTRDAGRSASSAPPITSHAFLRGRRLPRSQRECTTRRSSGPFGRSGGARTLAVRPTRLSRSPIRPCRQQTGGPSTADSTDSLSWLRSWPSGHPRRRLPPPPPLLPRPCPCPPPPQSCRL